MIILKKIAYDKKRNLPLSEDQKDDLDLITTFNLNVRYPDYKHEFSQKCTKEHAQSNIEKIRK